MYLLQAMEAHLNNLQLDDIQLTHLESVSIFESRLEKKSIRSLKGKVKRIMDNVQNRDVPSWDSIN